MRERSPWLRGEHAGVFEQVMYNLGIGLSQVRHALPERFGRDTLGRERDLSA